jgi:hypothetical protein
MSLFDYISAVRDSQIVHEGHPLKFPIKEAIVSFGVVNLKANYGFDFLERVEKITQSGSRFGTVIGDYQNELFICLDQENFAIPISEHVIATNDTKTEFTEASFSISTLYFYLNQYGIYNNAVPKYKKHFNNNLSHFLHV